MLFNFSDLPLRLDCASHLPPIDVEIVLSIVNATALDYLDSRPLNYTVSMFEDAALEVERYFFPSAFGKGRTYVVACAFYVVTEVRRRGTHRGRTCPHR